MRWVLRIIGALVLAVVVVGVGLLLLPGERIARIAADQVKAQTGRELSFEGDVSVTLWPVIGVETGPVRLANADWAGPEPMLQARSLSIGVAATDLLQGKIRLTRIVADGPELRLATQADGTGNWVFGAATSAAGDGTAAAAAGAGVQDFTLEQLRLTDARLVYAAHGAVPVQVNGVDLDLAWPDAGGAAQLKLGLRPAGEQVRLTAEVAQFAALISGKSSPVEVQVAAPGGQATFEGRTSTAGDAEGQIQLTTTDTRRFLGALAMPGVGLPEGMGRALQVSAGMALTPDLRLTLSDLDMALDANRLTGTAEIVLSDPPNVTARLAAGALDFSAAMGGGASSGGTGTSGGGASGGWDTTPIDASALGLMNGTISLTAQSIKARTRTLAPVRVALTLDRARGVLQLQELGLYGGGLTGELIANNRKGLSVAGDLTVKDAEMLDVLRDLAGVERLSGKGSAKLRFLGSGRSVDAIMNSLSGGGSLDMARGVISGLDLDRLLRSGEGTGGTTVFDSLTASYVIDKGNLQNDDLLILLSKFRANGKGRIGLGARDIDYLFTAVALQAASGQDVAIPIRIVGPWSSPKIRPDLSQVLQQNLKVKTEELEQRGKAEVQRKLEKELNIAPVEGRSVEETLKDGLESEAKKQLLKLLGKN